MLHSAAVVYLTLRRNAAILSAIQGGAIKYATMTQTSPMCVTEKLQQQFEEDAVACKKYTPIPLEENTSLDLLL